METFNLCLNNESGKLTLLQRKETGKILSQRVERLTECTAAFSEAHHTKLRTVEELKVVGSEKTITVNNKRTRPFSIEAIEEGSKQSEKYRVCFDLDGTIIEHNFEISPAF